MKGERFPRPLSAREVETLRFMLSVADERLDPLREQIEAVAVAGKCSCGCATIYLAVDRARARQAPGLCSPVADSRTRDVDARYGPFELILFLDDGWLESLEIAYYANQPPPEFPAITAFVTPWLRC
jgi:hypothetical protein